MKNYILTLLFKKVIIKIKQAAFDSGYRAALAQHGIETH